MQWQSQLITIYLMVCRFWEQGLWTSCQRMSNHNEFELTDQEVITIYLFGITRHRTEVKSIFNFTRDHLEGWFPQLRNYEAFTHRLNQISDCFILLSEMILASQSRSVLSPVKAMLTDSMPIILAKAKRSQEAKVAKDEIADKGYCASKGTYYYGVKLHVVGNDRDGALPIPEYIGITSASVHDLTAFRQVSRVMTNSQIFGDKAYGDDDLKQSLLEHNVEILTPVKLMKGQQQLDLFDKLFSSSVSAIRQPIESLFNWLQEKTAIQAASKVRSYRGLIVHLFGKLAAGLFLLFNSKTTHVKS
jgi:saccharopine dehydrogenase-like NADP-dependent oxidoreductase